MRWPASPFVLAAIFALAPAVTSAGVFGGPADCVGDLIADGKLNDLALAKVSADGRVHFQADRDGCPGSEARCQQKAYSVKGDLLVTAHRRGPWTCVQYPNRVGGTDGWVRSDQIAAAPVPQAPRASAWAGQWERDRQASINVEVKGAVLAIDGEAIWEGPNPGQVHDGELGGQARPHGDTLALRDHGDPCEATLRLLGPYLVVTDNGQCGGANVSFSGVYRRVSASKK